jgi:hypothetical protein
MARAASALSPAMRTIRPRRVARNAHQSRTATAMPIRNSTLMRSAASTCGTLDQKPNGTAGSCGALGWM